MFPTRGAAARGWPLGFVPPHHRPGRSIALPKRFEAQLCIRDGVSPIAGNTYSATRIRRNAVHAGTPCKRNDDAGPSCFGQRPSGSTPTPEHPGHAEGTSRAPCVGPESKAVRAGCYAYGHVCEITAALFRAPCGVAGTDRPPRRELHHRGNVSLCALLGPPGGAKGFRGLRTGVVRATSSRHCSPRGDTHRGDSHCRGSPPAPGADPAGSGSVQRASDRRATVAAIAAPADRNRGGRDVPPYR